MRLARDLCQWQLEFDHVFDLPLVRMSYADDNFLDCVRRIFGDRQPCFGRRKQRDAARLSKLQRSRRILVDEGLLDCRTVGCEARDDVGQGTVKRQKAQSQVTVARFADSVANVAQTGAVDVHNAPSGSPQARVDADDAHGALLYLLMFSLSAT